MHATNISTSDLGLTVPERRAVRLGAVHGWGFAFAVRVAVASSSFLIGSTMVLFVGAAWFTEPNAGVDALVFLGAAALWTVFDHARSFVFTGFPWATIPWSSTTARPKRFSERACSAAA